MVAVSGDHVVRGLEGRDGPDGDRLLADVQMEEATDLPRRVGARGLFLQATDEKHLAVQVCEVIDGARRAHEPFANARSFGGRDGRSRRCLRCRSLRGRRRDVGCGRLHVGPEV